MQKRRLGASDLEITPIGIGAWAMGGAGWQFGWGPQDDDESIAAIHAALDQGINWIDTAAIYGLGHSEEVVARALTGRSEKPLVFTKCGIVWDERREPKRTIEPESIRKEVEQSLQRLKLDVIDLYQIHWPEPDNLVEAAWTTMAYLKEQGKVRHIGVSNFNVQQMQRAQAIAPITSLQPPYSIISPEIEKEILPYTLREQYRRNRLFADEVRLAHRRDDARARSRDAGGRLSPAHAELQGAAPFEEPGTGRAARDHRPPARTYGGRSGDRVDATESGGDGRHRGDALGQTSGRSNWSG